MAVYLQDADLTVYHGDALATLRELPAESAHMCVTSPPFFGLRDYGVNGQIGLEESPNAWVASLVAVFREVHRVLRRDGTLWVEVGDSYASAPPGIKSAERYAKSTIGAPPGMRNGILDASTASKLDTTRLPGIKQKDLIGAPWLLAFALRADGWYLRSDIIWARPNPMPESVTDRPTKSHSYVFLLAKQPRYYYDADAIREPLDRPDLLGEKRLKGVSGLGGQRGDVGRYSDYANPAGRNKRSVWTIATQPLADEHYAAYPEALVEPCILAGTSERGVCPECGAPWVRETEASYTEAGKGNANQARKGGDHIAAMASRPYETRMLKSVATTGWRPTCTHNHEPIPAVVLDPFLGSGTTALVARRLGRKCVGIELSADYCQLIARRTQQLSLLGDAS